MIDPDLVLICFGLDLNENHPHHQVLWTPAKGVLSSLLCRRMYRAQTVRLSGK